MSTVLTSAAVAVLAPALGALILAVLPFVRRVGALAAGVCIATSLVACVAAFRALFGLETGEVARATWPWIVEGGRTFAEIGVHVDGVSAPMLCVVTLVALCVQVYSLAYLDDVTSRGRGRYFAYHALFLFSMNVLVVAPNLLQLFVGWELVGLASYLLIGFHFERPSAARAAVKAFWMTKLADMGFLFGLLALFVATGSFEWTAVPERGAATLVTLLLTFAVLGKSAQFPLHVWLPDAMEGPTPVSALLHAATMVAAGVFLIVRADPLFAAAPATRDVLLGVGSLTAVIAAGAALVQSDLKKVLAWSTCSQLGYMIAALGAGSAFAGFFHLGTHAFFKALLFLAAGSVIHAVHSNRIEDMGGLRRRMPVTAVCFLVGAASLSGVPGFAGFFSKDLVLTTLEGRAAWFPWIAGVLTAFLTSFYMGRVFVRVFLGEAADEHGHERASTVASAQAKRGHEDIDTSAHAPTHPHEPALAHEPVLAHEQAPALEQVHPHEQAPAHPPARAHAHEPSLAMAAPVLLLAVPSVLAGFLGPWAARAMGVEYHVHLGLTPIVASAVSILGWVAAFAVFRRAHAPRFAWLAAIERASIVDRSWAGLYRASLVRGAAILAWFDRYVIDGLVNVTGWATLSAGTLVRPLQTGFVRDYALVLVVGAILLVLLGVWR